MIHQEHNNHLQDGFSRQPSYLRLSLTDLCNFSCQYCLPKGYMGKKKPNELSPLEIKRLLKGFAQSGTAKVRLTGGEPSLRNDLPQIIETAVSMPGIEQVALTTNGYRLTQQSANWLAAGLQQINISIDSFQPEAFKQITGHDVLPNILLGIEQLLEQQNVEIKVNAVLLKNHAEQTFVDALNYVKSKPVTVRFIELMHTSNNPTVFADQHIRAQTLKQYLHEAGWRLRPRGPHSGPALEYSHPDYAGGIGLIAPYSKDFCASCNRLRVSSMGQLHLCLFDAFNYDLRPFLQTDASAELEAALQRFIKLKPAQHQLHQNNSGLMGDLATLGG